MRTEPAAIVGMIATFIVAGLLGLGDAGTIPGEVAGALAVLVPVVANLILRGIVSSPETVAKLAARAALGPAREL